MTENSMTKIRERFNSSEWPHVISMEASAHNCELSLVISPEIRWFEGHFPQQPVLAGVVQAHWAAEFGRVIFSISEAFSGMDNLKFQTVILPEARITLKLHYDNEKKCLKFNYFDALSRFSEGKLLFS